MGVKVNNTTHSSSNMAIIRDASGLFAICGICRNSLRSIDPDPSLWRACVHAHATEAGDGDGEETHYRACESFSRVEGRGASGGKHLSSFMKRFFSRSSSLALTTHTNTHSTRMQRTMQANRSGTGNVWNVKR